MTTFENEFSKVITFLKIYQNLIDCHLVDFLTENLWEECMPLELRYHIEQEGADVIKKIKQFNESFNYNESILNKFLKDSNSLKLENCSNIITRRNLLNILNYAEEDSIKFIHSEYMKVKKWHEVDIFTKTIRWLNQDKSRIIIDAGAGKGYFSLHLSNYYKLPVLAVESSQINHKGAITHRNLLNKKTKESTSLVQFAVEQINETTDFVTMVKEHFPYLNSKKELVMTALHACGSLTDSVIKSFLNISDMKCLCLVPCCYHLSSKSLLNTYEFSKNLRMLAQQSIDRIKQKDELLSPSLFYRAVLQVILHKKGIQCARIGRGAPMDNFIIYAKWALKKIEVKEIPSDDELERIYEEYKILKWKFDVFQLLRIHLAPVIEAAILLDKLLFMERSKITKDLKAIQLFDPILSPRSWAIIASK